MSRQRLIQERPFKWALGQLSAMIPFILVANDVACAPKEPPRTPTDSTAVVRTVSEGPVTLTLSADRGELPFSDSAEVWIELTAERNTTIVLDDYEQAVAKTGREFEFRLHRIAEASAAPTSDGKLRWSRRFRIEFFLPGEYELPAAEVRYFVQGESGTPDGADSSASSTEGKRVATEPLKIIAADAPGAAPSPEELAKIKTLPPVELREPWTVWTWAAAAAIATGVVLAAVLIARGSRGKFGAEPALSPDEWYRRQIAALLADELVPQGLIHEFYYRLSDVLRGYIERRFEVAAREMTTEEFLVQARRDARFGSDATSGLEAFMTACDLVKYARQRAGTAETHALLKAAGAFVERTRPAPTNAAAHSAGDSWERAA